MLVEAGMGQAHPAVCLAVRRIDGDGLPAVIDGRLVLVQLAVGGCPVAVVHGVPSVQLDGPMDGGMAVSNMF